MFECHLFHGETQMDVVTDLQAKNTAYASENKSLKDVIEQLDAQKNALDQTLREVLSANINFKAGLAVLEKRFHDSLVEAAVLKKTNEELTAELAKKDQLLKEKDELLKEKEAPKVESPLEEPGLTDL